MSFNQQPRGNSRSSVKVLVFDPVQKNQKTLCQILRSIGFENIDTARDMAQFQAALEFTFYDLIFAECCRDAGGESGNHADSLAKITTAMRFGDVGLNPYLVSINTAWLLNTQLTKNIINSGTDDLLARPFSTEDIERRIQKQVKSRKKFIVTSDYVGPDRRRNQQRSSDAFSFIPPNSLKAKVLGDKKSLKHIPTAVEASKATVTIEKMRRQPLRIGIIANLLGNASWDKSLKLAGKDKMEYNLSDLLKITEDLNKRIRETGFSHFEHLSITLHELAQTMMEKFRSGISLDTDDMELLKKHSASLQIAFYPEENEASIAANIISIICRRDLEIIS